MTSSGYLWAVVDVVVNLEVTCFVACVQIECVPRGPAALGFLRETLNPRKSTS